MNHLGPETNGPILEPPLIQNYIGAQTAKAPLRKLLFPLYRFQLTEYWVRQRQRSGCAVDKTRDTSTRIPPGIPVKYERKIMN